MQSIEHSKLIKAILSLLRPIVRILIRNEVSHAEFTELAKQAYVQEAYKHFTLPGRKMTYARVSVLTGLHRKEVVRITELSTDASNPLQAQPNRALRVVNGWLTDGEFSDQGIAKVLPVNGESACFRTLVERHSGDISMGAVLDELKRVGVVEMLDKDRVKLATKGYIPQDDELKTLEIISISASDLLHTGIHNLELKDEKPRFQRQVVHAQVPHDLADAFKVISEKEALELLQRLNSYLSEHRGKTNSENPSGRRVGLGIYFIDSE